MKNSYKKSILSFTSRLFLTVFLLLCFSAAPVSAQTIRDPAYTPIRIITHEKIRYVNLQDVAAHYGLKLRILKEGPLLFAQNKRIVFLNGKRSGTINNIAVTFYQPPLYKNGNHYISELDHVKLLYPILAPKLPYRRVLKIMIDPGHGGKDRGAAGPVLHEKVITLQIAKKLEKALKSYGFEVIMTRTQDKDLSLEARADLCEKYKPDLFISIHCNSVENKSVTGIETWYIGAQGGASAHGNKVKNAKDKGNAFDPYNVRISYEVQKGMMKQFPSSSDRGVKPSRFFVLRHASCPSLLMEVGFISNNKEGKSLATGATQDKIVKAIIDGMIGYTTALRKTKAER